MSLFLATNAAILVLISIVFQLFGFEGILAENGVDLNLQALLVMSAVIGFGGSFISLAMSKFLAKRSMGVKIIEHPANSTEQWLVTTVQRQAQQAGIGMPEVGIFDAEAAKCLCHRHESQQCAGGREYRAVAEHVLG